MALDTFKPYLFVSAGEQSDKYLTPKITNGIARFQAQRAQELTGLAVRIDPVQSGTGDPSPENVRPIIGRTGLTVTAAGENLIPNLKKQDSSVRVRLGESSVGNGVFYKAGAYKISWGLATAQAVGIYWRTFKNGVDGAINNSDTIVITEDANVKIWLYSSSGISVNNVTWFQVEDGTAATAYEPYVGHTYPITWQTEAGEVYGGTLDVVSGVLTVDWGYIASYDGETLPGEWISDRDVYAEGTTPTTGAEVAYKLAEPVTYQLDPEQIMTVPGFNQVYSDAGPVIDIKF